MANAKSIDLRLKTRSSGVLPQAEFEELRREVAMDSSKTAKAMTVYARQQDRRDAAQCAEAAASLFTAATK